MANDQFARPVEIDWFAAAADLKNLAEAEFRKRPKLPEYKDRYPSADIPLLALDVEPHEISGSEPIGRWCLNQGQLDPFSGEFLQIAVNVGSGLSFKPVNIDALAFLFHTLSLFLVTTEDLQQPGSKYLNLLTKPLADGRVIQVRQILSLIKATELFARHCGIAAKRGGQPTKLPDSSALPWLLVQEDENLRPGFAWYPKCITQPDGRNRTAPTREAHARLFTEDWLTRGIVTTLPNTDGDPRALTLEDPKLDLLPTDTAQGMTDVITNTRRLAAQDPTIIPPRKHGFEANMERHRGIAEIVTRYDPRWRQGSTTWKESDVLQSICTDLDNAAVQDDSGRYETPESWKKGGKTKMLGGAKANGWSDALKLATKKLVIDQIKASLKMVLKRGSAS